jgi:DNA mismatch endonuclease (patch repair protein)
MSRIRGGHTKPEWILRCGLHRLGFRYRLGGAGLPGRPDLVFAKYRTVVFVHGCFWHRHAGCRMASTPKSNQAFWRAKFARNVARDKANRRALARLGWSVVVVWECELYSDPLEVVGQVASRLRPSPSGRGLYDSVVQQLDSRELIRVAEERVRYRLGPRHDPEA